ncbi:hypothetical protein DL98DRAFT_573971 [Cadophora sp. DSE1049]|nr:hypothetical protein DL98DRAFT_573971 [Cadophora sp. DSE1049]
MADVRRNGFNRDMSCHWTAGTQNADTIGGVLEGLQSAASAILACSDRGPQTKTQTPIPASIRSTRPTPSAPSPGKASTNAGRPSIQPLATPNSAPSQASRTSKPGQVTPSPAAQTPKSNATILHPSVVSTQSLGATFATSTSTTPPEALIPIPKSPESSSLALSASAPFAPLLASELSPKQTPNNPPPAITTPLAISIGDASSELGSASPAASTNNKVSSRAGLIVGGVISGVILLTFLFTIYFCRRMKRKQHRRSLGYMSTAPMYKPWKKKEAERRNTIANLEGLLDLDRDRSKGRDRESVQAKPMRDRAVQFPTSAFAYERKGAASTLRPLTMPGPVFAPLRANRSSSLYSGSLLDGFGFLPQTFPPKARARSALLPPSRAGLQDGNAIVLNPFLTPSGLFKQKQKDSNPQSSTKAKTSAPRSDIYISRPYSIFDIADDELKGRERDSAISGLSKFEDMHPLSPSPLSHSSRAISHSGSRSQSRSRSRSISRSRASTPALSPSRSKTPSPSRLSQVSRVSSYATSTITKVERALVTVRDLDRDERMSLDVEQEYGYRLRELGARRADLNTQIGNGKVNVVGSKLKNEVVMILSEREVGDGNDSDGGEMRRGGGLEEWEEREMERRRKEREQAKARMYKGRIRPGMGVQKRGGGALGVERSQGEWEGSTQRRWTGWAG